MASPWQKRGGCGHLMAGFDNHSFCARCRDKGKGKDPCAERPESTDCKFCNTLPAKQRAQLSSPSYKVKKEKRGPRWQSGNTLASHLCGRGSIPVMALSGKAGSCLPLVGSLQYRTLANYMYWFPLPFQLPVVT